MSEQALSPHEIINLLSKIKEKTPDYPLDLMAARKAAFLKEAVTIPIHTRGMSGKGGGDGGVSGSGTLGGMSSAQAILLQAVIGVWVIAAMLTAAYVFRNQIIDLLRDNGIVSVEVTLPANGESANPTTLAPSPQAQPTEFTPAVSTANPGAEPDIVVEPTEESPGAITDSKDNQGLHLGQTPGAPDTPNQDKPGDPDKPKDPGKPNNTKKK